jgi:hypothetical protein
MPQDNIKRAIQRGTGELEGVSYEEITFEGYGPGGVAIIVDVTTDNRNRAVSEIRHAFSKNGGNLGESGSVRFMFSKKGLIAIEKDAATEEQLMDIVLEHGGEDLNDEGDTWEILPIRRRTKRCSARQGGGNSHRDERSDHGRLDLYQARRQPGQPDDSPAGGSGRPATTRRTSTPTSTWTPSRWSTRRAELFPGRHSEGRPDVAAFLRMIRFLNRADKQVRGRKNVERGRSSLFDRLIAASICGRPAAGAVAASSRMGTIRADFDNPLPRSAPARAGSIGPFVNGGVGLGNRTTSVSSRAGVEVGKV